MTRQLTHAKYLVIPIITALLLVSLSYGTRAARPNSVGISSEDSTEPISISVRISEAYYADIDNDGLEDDIYSTVQIDLSGSQRYFLDYYITLTLPSGLNFSYYYSINTVWSQLTIGNYFWNHAIEQGDYTLTVQAILWTGGISHAGHSYTFDPPGGSDEGDPTFDITVN